MTYMTSPRLRRRYGNRNPAELGSWLTDAWVAAGGKLPPSESSVCLAKANAETAGLDAKINLLASEWRPTGFFAPAQVRALVSNAMQVVANARAAVNKQMAATIFDADKAELRSNLADMARAEQRSMDYLNAATAAETSGASAVNAPGMKTWVTQTMTAASSGFTSAYKIGCELPWWVGTLKAFADLVASVVVAIKKIVGVSIAVGEAVLDVARDTAESLPVIWQIVKWGGLAALGVLAVWKLKEHRKTSGL